MKARDIMTIDVATAGPGTSVRDIARLLLDKHQTALSISRRSMPGGVTLSAKRASIAALLPRPRCATEYRRIAARAVNYLEESPASGGSP